MSERHRERWAEMEIVCTDLFLLNSSRFNQQIIDLIKWHPLLGQEPARSMQISQAKNKKKICLHEDTLALFLTPPNKLHTPHSAFRLCGCLSPLWWTILKKVPHSLPSHQKQIQAETERQDQGAELQHEMHRRRRVDQRRQQLPLQINPSLHTTESKLRH